MIPKLELTEEERSWIYEHADANGWLFEQREDVCEKLCRCGQGVQRTFCGRPGIELRGQILVDVSGYQLSELLGVPMVAKVSW